MARSAILAGLLLNCTAMAQGSGEFFYKKLNLIVGYPDNRGLIRGRCRVTSVIETILKQISSFPPISIYRLNLDPNILWMSSYFKIIIIPSIPMEWI